MNDGLQRIGQILTLVGLVGQVTSRLVLARYPDHRGLRIRDAFRHPDRYRDPDATNYLHQRAVFLGSPVLIGFGLLLWFGG